MESLFGLPAHVFFVHLPLVAVPALSVAAVVNAGWRSPPRWFHLFLVVAALVVVVATWLAVESGEAFDELLDGKAPTEKHEELARSTMLFVGGLALGIWLLVGWRWRAMRRGGPLGGRGGGAARLLLAAATVVLAVLSTVWVVRAGHEGARITWDGVVPKAADG